MGMFDYVDYEGHLYQTKSTDGMSYHYVVEGDKLFQKMKHIACTPVDAQPLSYEWAEELRNQVKEVIFEELLPARAHGVLEIHDYDPTTRTSIQKYLKFTDDRLVDVWESDGPREHSGIYINVDQSEWRKKVQEWEDNHYPDWLKQNTPP